MDNIKATEKDEDGNTVLHLVLGDTSAKILSVSLYIIIISSEQISSYS